MAGPTQAASPSLDWQSRPTQARALDWQSHPTQAASLDWQSHPTQAPSLDCESHPTQAASLDWQSHPSDGAHTKLAPQSNQRLNPAGAGAESGGHWAATPAATPDGLAVWPANPAAAR